jgi:hypothetical protein
MSNTNSAPENFTRETSQPVDGTTPSTSTTIDGATSALARAPLQGAGNLLSRFAYSTGYCLSYGVVFPTLLFLNVVPGARVLTSGFVDGAAAADNYVRSLRSAPQPASLSRAEGIQPAMA